MHKNILLFILLFICEYIKSKERIEMKKYHEVLNYKEDLFYNLIIKNSILYLEFWNLSET